MPKAPTSDRSLDLLGPPFLAQEPLPLGWTTCLHEAEVRTEEGLAQGQGAWSWSLCPGQTGVGAGDWGHLGKSWPVWLMVNGEKT